MLGLGLGGTAATSRANDAPAIGTMRTLADTKDLGHGVSKFDRSQDVTTAYITDMPS